jgi:hypothetical protein
LLGLLLACQDPLMSQIDVTEVAPGKYRLYLVAGTTDVDDVVSDDTGVPSPGFRQPWRGGMGLPCEDE